MNLSKGSISYQINLLEHELGFKLFNRTNKVVNFTKQGLSLWHEIRLLFDKCDTYISDVSNSQTQEVTIATTSYFASRWLSPKLMLFMDSYPDITIKLQLTIDFDVINNDDIDIQIRWSNGSWDNQKSQLLFYSPIMLTGGQNIYQRLQILGDVEHALCHTAILHDDVGSNVWQSWCDKANISTPIITNKNLIIQDPNIRVDAVINNQGVAFNDLLVQDLIDDKKLFILSDITLDNYGYYVARHHSPYHKKAVECFYEWMVQMATDHNGL